MVVKDIKDEDYTNYKKASMFIATSMCNWKCCKEQGLDISICQNQPISKQPNIYIPTEEIFRRYIGNDLTNAIVFGGLEPFLQFEELIQTISYFRGNKCDDDIVIYTGYYENEIQNKINNLKMYKNIIIKFGRYIPNQKSHYDEILGIQLASDNQYGKKVS